MNKILTECYIKSCQFVQSAAKQAGKDPKNVQLLAVSKTKSNEQIKAISQLGQKSFGENYAQEAIEKAQALANLNLEWHFIGPVQSNKTKGLAENMSWVQTVERAKIAQRLNEQRPVNLPPLNVCIQVNISNEAQKSGVAPSEVLELAKIIAELPNLRLRGLMAIAEDSEDSAVLAAQFTKMNELFLALQNEYQNIDTLSMGMSHDMELAIKHGSTMVRIGTAIFGGR